MIYGDGTCAMGDHPAKSGQLMCAQDWRRVPVILKNHVNQMHARWMANACTLGELREAQDAAVRSLGGEPRSDL